MRISDWSSDVCSSDLVLFGPNGSGKSSLLATIMGLAPYRVTSGEIWFKGQRIDALPVDKRAQMGLGMSFQRPPALEGVTVEAFTAAIGSSALLESEASALDFNGFAERDVNAGFSGRSEEPTSELQSLMRTF